MPPSSADVAQTPEPKSTGGLASVFKSLTGSRSSKTPLPNAHPHPSATTASLQIAQQLNISNASRGGVYGGPLEFEHLYGQLKTGKSFAERRSAADTLRLALADYSLSGVCPVDCLTHNLLIFGYHRSPKYGMQARI
jgi:hypothetical protein